MVFAQSLIPQTSNTHAHTLPGLMDGLSLSSCLGSVDPCQWNTPPQLTRMDLEFFSQSLNFQYLLHMNDGFHNSIHYLPIYPFWGQGGVLVVVLEPIPAVLSCLESPIHPHLGRTAIHTHIHAYSQFIMSQTRVEHTRVRTRPSYWEATTLRHRAALHHTSLPFHDC